MKTSACITRGTWEFHPPASPCSCLSSAAAVHKRIKEGKLTAFFFYITHVESTFFGTKRKVKLRPYILVSVSECKAWAEEMKRRMGYVDEPDESLMKQRTNAQAGGGGR